MAHPGIPSIHLQPPSVDFIDNRLPNFHDVFRDRDVHYDPVLRRYVENRTITDRSVSDAGERQDNSQALVQSSYSFGDVGDSEKFWGLIFPDAMKKFIKEYPNEPKQRDKSGYSIRTQTTWDGVNEQLHKAREVYDGTKQGFRGRCKRVFRRIGENTVEPAQNIIRLVPDIDYVSPVLGAVQLLLSAFTIASSVRETVASSLEDRGLDDLFADVEVFLITFPDMSKVKDAAVSLVVSVMKAIEDAIGFFISNQIIRAASAIGRGKTGYQKPLLESLGEIQKSSQKLIHQAQNAHFASTQMGLNAIWNDTGRLVMSQRMTGQAMEYLIDKVDRGYREGAQFYNTVHRLLLDAEESKKARDLSLQNKIASLEEKIASLEGSSRASTPGTPEHTQVWPNQQTPWVGYPPQFGSYLPAYHNPWPGAFSPPEMIPGPSFSASSYSSLPINLSHQYHTVSPPPPQPPRIVSSSRLLDLLNIPLDLDKTDLDSVQDGSYRIPRKLRAQAEQVTRTMQFRDWIVTPSSRRLLIHGELPRQSLATWHVSPLSHFCAMMMHMLRARENYIPLVFFCGCHVEPEDGNIGAEAMMKSLLVQLLQQIPFAALTLDKSVDLNCLSESNCSVSKLCDLFVWLVQQQLTREYTLVCMVDGIGFYETDEFEPDVVVVMKMLLRLSGETSKEDDDELLLRGDIKVLITTPSTTDAIQGLFEDMDGSSEMSFISMSGLPDINEYLDIPEDLWNNEDSEDE
ncbi:hypothetical protein TGAM01_v204113 [Trichoderma gamsii]|uniref:Fungal STAND N-terminal Goodbye domain-containing protein n=1 Tax=Trichoderma gamsii TaxID=398673 RepID=A0A2P4ZS93_9HYPO|nr:hypothetical protein TGAM01_v204113 [Trichoderma gamsii]PON27164.1 hypothetical protein TGAM01_v204113 [Trichoderma gamsii]